MFSFIKKLTFRFFQSDEDVVDDECEDEEKILSKLISEEIEHELPETSPPDNQPLGESQPVEFDIELFKFVFKTGRITAINKDFGIIDDSIYFKPSQVTVAYTPKVDDEISYSVYKAKENEIARVYKVYGLKDSCWDFEGKRESEESKTEDEKEVTAMTREITGRVIQRKGRQCFIEPINIWCNLDEIEASYVPLEGDWVTLEAKVQIDENTVDLVGDILEVTTLKPLLTKTGVGRITLWSDFKKEGAIENIIYFTQISCENGYVPNFGDEVMYDAIESDQENYKWRALVIFPEKIANNVSVQNEKMAYYDKNGISILPTLCTVEVELNQTKKVTLEIKNNGNIEHFLTRTRFRCSKEKSQLSLKSHRYNDSFVIKPKEVVQYVFECRGKYLGFNKETFLFCFKNFTISKIFDINVCGNKEMSEFLDCKADTIFKQIYVKSTLKSNLTAEKILFGKHSWKPPKFKFGRKRGVYKIPNLLWTALGGDSGCSKTKTETMKALIEYAPYLKQDLNINNYSDRFHTFLYLEEIELKRSFRNFDMNGVFLLRNGEYLVLEVPGLAEQRPSLIIGDKVIISQPWSETNNVQHIGYIQEIHQKDVFIKFHLSFHDSYDESQCDVIFEPTIGNFSKCHDAVNQSLKILGAKWLFPTSVNEKPPLVSLEVEKSDTTNILNEVPENSTKMETTKSKKTLTWYNKALNKRQKLAVLSILKGQGRPLPYIVFGPPGTGKTVTLIEAVMQIVKLFPDSRILVTSPSNSSADLICERLIDYGKFKPGQLVRLMAIHRALNGNISPKLVPYCAVVDYSFDNEKSPVYTNQGGFKLSSMSKLVGRQRITVGTCLCTGSLHYLGFSPGHFTHILVDEAGQATEPDVLVSATFQNLSNGQVVLIGDPLQLGPVCLNFCARQFGFDVSLLQRFISSFPYSRDFDSFPDTCGYDPRFITKLNVNYRSVPEILSLPNQLFYNSELIPTVSQTEGPEADIIKKFHDVMDINENVEKMSAVFLHGVIGQNYQENDSPSWYNPHEIWLVVTYIRKCYEIGLTSDDVGVVTPYLKQVQKLRTLLAKLNLSAPKIGTVEDFQGQERQVIIISIVRSSWNYISTDMKHFMGFVASPQRLNVALTRARALLIILGNPLLLSMDPYWRKVVEYCVKNKSCLGCNFENGSEETQEE